MREVPESRPVAPVRRWPAARHLLLSIVMWAVYVLYWRVVLVRGIESEARLSGVLLGLFLILQSLTTAAWIAHNRGIEERKRGRRRARPKAPREPSSDFVGRPLLSQPEEADLTRAPVVVVRVRDGKKVFEAGLELEPEQRGRAQA